MRNRQRRLGRVGLVAIMALLALMLFVPAALADSYWTPYTNIGTIGGVYYQIRTAVTDFDDGSGVTSRTTTYADQALYADQCRVVTVLYNGQGTVMSTTSASSAAGDTAPYTVSAKKDNHGYYYANGYMFARFSDGVTWSALHWSDTTVTIHHTD